MLWIERLCLLKIHVEILMPNVIVLVGKAFVRCLSHEGRTRTNETSVFSSFCHVRIHQKVCGLEEGPHPTMLAGIMISDF